MGYYMELLSELLAFAVIGIILNIIVNVFKSLTGKDLSSETFEESKKELEEKVLNSKPANYVFSGLFPDDTSNLQQHNFEEQQ